MSKLESAFLKAMRKEQPEVPMNNGLCEGWFEKPNKPVSETPEKRNIFSSRKQILGMSQDRFFSVEDFTSKRLIFSSMSDKLLLNKYRNLRTKLLETCPKGNSNFVTLVTSVVPQGGASLIATNLAIAFAFDGSKTATLVDADIKNQQLSKLLGVKPKIGLTEYLESEDCDTSEVLYKTAIPRLRFVPSGLDRENASEYFTSDKMKNFLSELIKRYPDRYPIIDAPSISQSADTQILIEQCDKIVLVIPYGKCTEEEISYAAITIGKEKLAGVVLNQF